MPIATLLITSYKRSHLLRWGLKSIAKQNISKDDLEIIVLNDGIEDDTKNVCDEFDTLNIKYIFTGIRNTRDKELWRIPGYAFNIGAKASDSKYLFLSCAEMYHVDNLIYPMINALNDRPKSLVIPYGKDDNGEFLKSLIDKDGAVDLSVYNRMPDLLNIHLPFFIAMCREEYMIIHGYDEEFTGIGWDDNDLVSRLNLAGNTYFKIRSRVIHLWHPRTHVVVSGREKYKYNEDLFFARRGIVKRNEGKEWGILK